MSSKTRITGSGFRRGVLRSLRTAALFAAGMAPAIGPHAAQAQPVPLDFTGGPAGTSPTGNYSVNNLESIDNVYGGVSYRIPLAALPPGRAGSSLSLPLIYNSNFYSAVQINGTSACGSQSGPTGYYTCLFPATATNTGGWSYGNHYGLELSLGPNYGGTLNCGPPSYLWYQLSAVFPDGSTHVLHLNGGTDYGGDAYYQDLPGVTPVCPSQPFHSTNSDYVYYTNDGTYLKVVIAWNSGTPCSPGYNCWTSYTWTMSFPDGTQVLGEGSQTISITDRNGNQTAVRNIDTDLGGGDAQTLQYVFEDAFGRAISVLHTLGTGSSSTDVISQTGANGSSMNWTVQWALQQLTGFVQYPCGGPAFCDTRYFQFPAVTQITFPANDETGFQPTYHFQYDTADFGQLNKVIMPSGASVQYTYTYGSSNTSYPMSPPHNPLATKAVTWCDEFDLPSPVQPTASCSSASGTQRTDNWSYIFGYTSSAITGPDNGVTTSYFPSVALSPSTGGLAGGVNAGLVYETQAPDGSTVEQQWATATPGPQSSVGNPFLQYSIHSVAASGSPSLAAVSTFQYDLNGNLTLETDNDFVAYSSIPHASGVPNLTSAPGTTLRTTSQTFVSSPTSVSDPNAYWNESSPAIRNEVSCRAITGNLIGSTATFAYDAHGNVNQELDWDSTTSGAQAPSQPACPATLIAEPATGGNAISTTRTWTNGNLMSVTDARGSTTNFTYDSNALYLTQTSGTGVPGTTAYNFDFNSGLLLSKTDYNGLTTANVYDNLNRVAQTTQSGPSGLLHMARTIYDDVNRRVATFDDNATPGDQQIVSITDYDQLGRQRLARVLESGTWTPASDDMAGIKTQTRYLYSPSLGHGYQLVSNPYRAGTSSGASGESTMGWTMSMLDRNGRTIQVQAFPGAAAPAPFGTNSSGNQATITGYSTLPSATPPVQTVTVTDPNNVQRVNSLNGIGLLTSVQEVGISQTTSYGYDALGNLWTVKPSGYGTTTCTSPQTVSVIANRSFIYDSLGRLETACNPESGTTNYTYDQNGNLASRKDGRGSMMCFGSISSNVCTPGYDAFNRPVQKTYNDSTTPPACYSYYAGQDFLQTAYTVAVNGACTAGAVNSYTWSNYDALGRPGTGVESVSGQGTWTFPSVLWTPQGQVSSITYPSGRVVNTSFDPAGRPDLVTGSLNATMKNYVGSATYAAHGALAGMTLGDTVARTFSYNSFLQVTSVSAGSLMTLGFGYSSSQNNGNLLSQSIARPGFAVNQGYWYDGANRLCAGVESVSVPSVSNCSPTAGANWSQLYTFDTVGNRAVTAGSSTLAPNFVPTGTSAFNAKNQWAGAGGITPTYDAAGNLISVVVPAVTETMTFDAESRMTSFDGATVTMTYDALGRRMTKAAATTGTTVYVYDPAGNLAVESGGAQTQTQTLYLTQDHLGSTRLVTNASGTVVGCHDYAPFGEEIPGTWGSRPPCYGPAETAMKFTGQERDPETAVDLNGFDNFQARMLAGTMGRFLSPDPDNAGADPANPQSWNMYSYAINNPLRFIDPSGLDPCPPGSTADTCANVTDQAPGVGTVIVAPGQCVSVSVEGQSNGSFCNTGGYPVQVAQGPSPLLPSLSKAPSSGLTKKQAACAADAAINGALSIFVPGYAAGKALASFGGFSLNIVGGLTGTSGFFSGGNPTPLQTVGGLAGANEVYQDSRFAAAGGASALARVQDLTSRVGFGAQTASRQGRLLSQLGNLESLEGAASFASKANNITAGISAGYDIYKCVTTP